MSWQNGPYLAFDTETTGANPSTARLVTAAAITVSQRGVLERRYWLLRPAEPIPNEATAVHGITTAYAQEFGVEPAAALEEVAGALHRAWSDGHPVVAMNARFDLTLLRAELERYGLPPLALGPVLDPRVLDFCLDRYRKGKRRLSDLAATYGVESGEAHSSDGDALTAARVVWRQLHRPEFLGLSLAQVQQKQAEAYAAWAENFQEWLVRNGKTETVERNWL